MAKAHLDEVQKFFIENNRHMSVEELASKLGKGVGTKTVQTYLEENPVPEVVVEEVKPVVEVDPLATQLKTKDFILTHSSDDRVPNGVAIMTQVASEICDENVKALRTLEKVNTGHIHRPKPQSN